MVVQMSAKSKEIRMKGKLFIFKLNVDLNNYQKKSHEHLKIKPLKLGFEFGMDLIPSINCTNIWARNTLFMVASLWDAWNLDKYNQMPVL